jgi:hypothetical protein
MIPDDYRRFLLEQTKAGSIRHGGRTLYAHLAGTCDLLETWNSPVSVCAAGLFHSVYGTNMFRRWVWPIGDRETIRELIGDDAERLVYMFATMARPAAFCVKPDTPVLRALREIEAANLIEQKSQSKWLWRLMFHGVSEPAEKTLTEYLNALAEAA